MTAPSKRRWFQFSLRTMLVAMFVLSCLLGGFGWRLQRAKQQAAAVATIHTLGGDIVRYDYSLVEHPGGTHSYDKKLKSPLPSFLVAYLGEDFFHNAVVVEATNRHSPKTQELQDFWRAISRLPKLQRLVVSDGWLHRDGLAGLQGSPEIRTLIIDASITNDDLRAMGKLIPLKCICAMYPSQEVNDQGIASLDGLTDLTGFYLSGSNISDVGAKRLAESHPALEELELHGSRIGDDSAVRFGKLSHLEKLDVFGTDITDKGLAAMGDLQSLRELNLSGTKVTSDGFAALANLHSLRDLNLSRTKVTGDGLSHLQHLPALKSLLLEGNSVTDADLSHLETFQSLQFVDLRKTKVTDEGLEKFELPPQLNAIALAGPEITDRTLVALARQPQLKEIQVSETKVTPAGLAAFSKALPKCMVW